MAFYRRNLPHLQRDEKAHFVTFCTHQREQLPPWARDIVLDCCLHDHGKRAEFLAVVVMPEHEHMIFFPLVDKARQKVYTLAEIMQPIKSSAAHLINERAGRKGQLWQEESFDHVLRSSESLQEKIHYILENPLRRGLANSVFEYKWLWTAELRSAAQARAPGPTQPS